MFIRADQKRRQRLMVSVASFLKSYYPQFDPGDFRVYDEYEVFVNESRGRYRGGVMMRQEENAMLIHVVAPLCLFRDAQVMQDFLTFMHHHERTRRLKSWQTFIRTDRLEVMDAAFKLGFRPVGELSAFTAFEREVLA